MHTRRTSTLPVLSLALPRPPLPRAGSGTPAPQTPRAPSATLRTRSISSPRTSSDSWGSYSEHGDDEGVEWSQDNVSLLARALELLPHEITTPFYGPVPPSNFLDRLAREIIDAKGGEWPHSVRATRVKLMELAKSLAQQDTIHEEEDEELYRFTAEEGKENISIKRPLYRQSSMDFLPKKKDPQVSSSLGRLSSRLQRTDRFVTTGYHPYPRPSSRSPSPPLLESETSSRTVPSTRSQTVRARPVATLGAGSARPPIRRITSMALMNPSRSAPGSSEPATPIHQTPVSGSTDGPKTGTIPTRVKRAGSFNVPPNPVTLKRAPSFNSSASLRSVATVASALARVSDTTPDAQSSDEEEKGRQRKSKRARTGTSTSVNKGVTQSPKTRSMSKAENATNIACIAPKDGKTTTKLRPRQLENRRSPSFFGEELPFIPAQQVDESKMPFPADRELSITPPDTPLQSSDEGSRSRTVSTIRPSTKQRPKLHIDTQSQNQGAAASNNQRTLRRSRMTTFPTRRISFSNFTAPSDAQPNGTGLQSAIQLS